MQIYGQPNIMVEATEWGVFSQDHAESVGGLETQRKIHSFILHFMQTSSQTSPRVNK